VNLWKGPGGRFPGPGAVTSSKAKALLIPGGERKNKQKIIADPCGMTTKERAKDNSGFLRDDNKSTSKRQQQA
jgi:hypothetical protein